MMEMMSKAIVDGVLQEVSEKTRRALEVGEETRRNLEIKEKYGKDAREVAPYKPNRKQRRAQKARQRSK